MSREYNAKEALILRLFRSFPGAENKISEKVLAQYHDGVDGYSIDDIQRAVELFRDGYVDRKGNSFVPTVPELALEIRRLEMQRNTAQSLKRSAVKQLEGRDRDEHFQSLKTPETRARVKTMAQAFREEHSPQAKKKTPEQIARDKELLARQDTRMPGEFIEGSNGLVSAELARKLMGE